MWLTARSRRVLWNRNSIPHGRSSAIYLTIHFSPVREYFWIERASRDQGGYLGTPQAAFKTMPEHQKGCSPPSIVFFVIKSAASTLLDASELRPKCFVPQWLKSKRFEDYAIMIMMIYRKAAFTTLPRIQSVFIIGHRIVELTAVQLLKARRRMLDDFPSFFAIAACVVPHRTMRAWGRWLQASRDLAV